MHVRHLAELTTNYSLHSWLSAMYLCVYCVVRRLIVGMAIRPCKWNGALAFKTLHHYQRSPYLFAVHLNEVSIIAEHSQTLWTVENGSMTIETNLFETTFISDRIHLRLFHLRPHPFEITFILRHVVVKLFWFTVHQIIMMYLPLLWEDLKILQGYVLPCPGVIHAGL